MALTFDDGPGPYTEALIHTLLGAGAPATFFMIGEHVDTFPDSPVRSAPPDSRSAITATAIPT